MYSVAVIGASGYAGGELLRLIQTHPDLRCIAAAAHGNVGAALAEVHRGLAIDGSFCSVDDALAAAADLYFLALPHGRSAQVADAIAQAAPDSRIVDLGGDHRLVDGEAWAAFYGGDHAEPWLYGLPEFPGRRAAIGAATRVANPGCFPTATALAVLPAVSSSLIDASSLVCTALTGTSGAGRSASLPLLSTEVIGAARPYRAAGRHQHTPEIEQTVSALAGQSVHVSFTPVLAPMTRGILAICTASALSACTEDALARAYSAAYTGEPFVRLLPAGTWPDVRAVVGGNGSVVSAQLDPRTGRVTMVCAIDNLGKGAAGQALQNANIMLGLPEGAGLTANGAIA